MIALSLFALAAMVSGSLGQSLMPPSAGGKISQGCLDSLSKIQSNQCLAKAPTNIDPNGGFDQLQKTLSAFIDSTCPSQCRETSRSGLSDVQKACTSDTDKMVAVGANVGIFGLDMLCLKSSDGSYCQLKTLDYLKKNNLKLNELMNWATPGSTNGTINVEKLPKELVCSDCFKKMEEQSYAFSVSLGAEAFNINPKVNLDTYKKIRKENVAKINAMCGANFVAEDPKLELGTTDAPPSSSADVVGSTLLNAVGGLVVGFGLLNL
ncbi:hypothetical protein BKA69DRAFT_1096904 [Paraphysoderma sedebokerense]|nr:hypothetical protein BKA69DRAFT_1096904 [Paraphysoderma sedebokerense]